MKRRLLISFNILLLCIIFTGCWDSRPVDELGVISSITIDKEEDSEKLKLYITRPFYELEKKNYSGSSFADGDSISDAIAKMQKKENKVLVVGSVRTVFISESIAREGINNIIHQLDKMSEFENQAYIAILRGDASKILNLKPVEQQRVGIYLESTIDSSIKSQLIPEKRFYEVMIDNSLRGKSMVIPIVLFGDDDNHLVIDGIAVFKYGKMMGTLNTNETLIYMIISQRVYNLSHEIPMDILKTQDINTLSFVVRNNNVKINTSIKEDTPEINVNIKLNVDIFDYTTKDYDIEGNEALSKEDTVKKLEKLLSSYFQSKFEYVINKVQKEYKTDIFGFGEKVRVQNNDYFNKIKWQDIFETAKIKVNTTVKLREIGVNK